MIITRSPLRVTLGGGGTDIPSFYCMHGGFTVGAAIDKYVYIAMHPAFKREIIIRYSDLERVNCIDDINHPLFRECLRLVPPHNDRFEITSMADVPAGTGLGSSGAFTCALLKALHAYNGDHISAHELAEEACKVEIGILKEPVGKQDQFCSAYGGLNTYTYANDGEVTVKKLQMPFYDKYRLEENLRLFFTGYTRSASQILENQNIKVKEADPAMRINLFDTERNGKESASALSRGDLRMFADLMNEQWDLKGERTEYPENVVAARLRMFTNGARGVKLIGAGGGGFLMAYWPSEHPFDGIGEELRFRFDYEGTKVMTL
jgi:D-glycero-alpha-D-manno-heptose-7-phosphate kinase